MQLRSSGAMGSQQRSIASWLPVGPWEVAMARQFIPSKSRRHAIEIGRAIETGSGLMVTAYQGALGQVRRTDLPPRYKGDWLAHGIAEILSECSSQESDTFDTALFEKSMQGLITDVQLALSLASTVQPKGEDPCPSS